MKSKSVFALDPDRLRNMLPGIYGCRCRIHVRPTGRAALYLEPADVNGYACAYVLQNIRNGASPAGLRSLLQRHGLPYSYSWVFVLRPTASVSVSLADAGITELELYSPVCPADMECPEKG